MGIAMASLADLFARLKLRHLLFGFLLLTGTIPLAVSSYLLVGRNRDVLETQEMSYLTRSAQFLSVELDGSLVAAQDLLGQVGRGVLAPGGGDVADRLRQPWVAAHLEGFLASQPSYRAVRLLDASGAGPQFLSAPVGGELASVLGDAFAAARERGEAVHSFAASPEGVPLAIVTVPLAADGGKPLFIQGVAELQPMATFFREEAQGDVEVLLIDRGGKVIWSEGADQAAMRAVEESTLVRDFVSFPLNLTAEYLIDAGGREREMLGRVSPVASSGWGVVVQKPVATSFVAVRQMVVHTAISSAILLFLALALAVVAARRISAPIQELATTSSEIAAGNFGKRVKVGGVGAEIGALAQDFNRMSDHLQGYIERLQHAARANQELFIGSMRAFVAAIDAKDPYTRGHSERVAAHSRTIARYLGLDEETQHRVWVGALLHDVGKIGIEDRILKKGGVLTDEEFEIMKLHPVIGAEIMSRIEQLREMIPAIRWHHEAWNGHGYPDRLEGARIPLMARIVAVADTFDAITTNRPYQQAYTLEFALQRLRELAGRRFDAKMVSAFLMAYEAGEVQLSRAPAPVERTGPAEVAGGAGA